MKTNSRFLSGKKSVHWWLTLLALSVSGSVGALQIAASSSMTLDNVQGFGFSLTNVTTSNAGVWEWKSMTNGGGRTKETTISGGAFTNSGTIELLQFGDVINNASTGWERKLAIFVKDGAAFTNSGVINISNSTPDNTPKDQYATLDVSANAGAFTNSGLINITNAATNTASYSAATKQYARLKIDHGNFTNSGTVSISVAGAEDYAFHYATLLVSSDWTNTGVMLIDGANKSLATASLDLGAKNYTQTGAAAELRLNHGGKVIAKNTTIDGGIISASGTGVITGNAVINSGATWEIGALGVDVLNISGDLTLSGAALSLTGAVSEGDWLLASYGGDLLGSALNFSGLPDDFEYLLNSSVANQLYLNITAIPEPATWELLLTGATLLLTLRRRM